MTEKIILGRRALGTGFLSEGWAQLGSNQRPRSYELPALTAELWALAKRIVAYQLGLTPIFTSISRLARRIVAYLRPLVKGAKPINSHSTFFNRPFILIYFLYLRASLPAHSPQTCVIIILVMC